MPLRLARTTAMRGMHEFVMPDNEDARRNQTSFAKLGTRTLSASNQSKFECKMRVGGVRFGFVAPWDASDRV